MDPGNLSEMQWGSQGAMPISGGTGTRIGRGTLILVRGRIDQLLQIVTISSPLAHVDLKGIG